MTIEDVIESLLGAIQDEYDEERPKIRRIDDRTFLLDGTLRLEELERAKPSSAKGRYFQRITLTSTMGPGVKIDPARMFVVAEDGASA